MFLYTYLQGKEENKLRYIKLPAHQFLQQILLQ